MKTKTKSIIVLMIALFTILTIGSTKVNASSNYEHSIKKDKYILNNPYFDTKDVEVEIQDSNVSGRNPSTSFWVKTNKIPQQNFDKIVTSAKDKFTSEFLVQIDNDITEVKISKNVYNFEIDKYEEISLGNAEIREVNNKKYAVINTELKNFENGKVEFISEDTFSVEFVGGKSNTKRDFVLNFDFVSDSYFNYIVNVISEKGVLYGVAGGTNGFIGGSGLVSLPAKLDFSKTYIEYLTSEYVGSSIKIDSIGNVPYVGKYGKYYKYKTSLKDVKADEYGCLHVNETFSYKGSQPYSDFQLDDNYTIDNEIKYTPKKQTNTDTKLKFDMEGNFKGTIKAEEVTKGDIIYNKVQDQLKDYNNPLYLDIRNIYIEDGSFEGNLKLTFYVGEQYNGKYYCITHMKNWYYEFEKYEGIVENGKIEITVDSLSPFGIVITEKQDTSNNENQNTTDTDNKQDTNNKGEKDETPKTGIIDIAPYIMAVTIMSAVGIIAVRKKQTK